MAAMFKGDHKSEQHGGQQEGDEGPRRVVVAEPEAVRARLLELGVPLEALEEVRSARVAARSAASSALHPVIAGGLHAWTESVRALREKLIPLPDHEWRIHRVHGSEQVMSSQGVAIVIAKGNKHTGVVDQTPSTATPKAAVEHAAQHAQLDLFGDPATVANDRAHTWFLLFHQTDSQIRFELSFPTMFAGGYPVEWGERIIPPSYDLLEPEPERIAPPSHDEMIDVPVMRRA